MFESLIHSVQEFWDDVKVDDFCVPCFVKGLAKGAAIGLTALLVIASLPAAAATAAAVVLTVVGVAGAAVLAARWKTMTGAEKSEVLGDLAGGLIAGGIGLARPPPGIQFLSASTADGATVLVPVLATSEAPAMAGAAAGAATAGTTALSTGGGTGSDGTDDTSKKTKAEAGEPEALSPAEVQRRHALGEDPAVKQYRPQEEATAVRIEEKEGVTLERYEPEPGGKGDWVDPETGTVYDGCSPASTQHFDKGFKKYDASMQKHLNHPDVDRVVVDKTDLNLTPEQNEKLTSYLDSLPAEQQSKILRIGF